MSYTKEDLKKKILELYPDIEACGLSLGMKFDETKDAWVLTFEKDIHNRHAFLDKKDADACMDGNQCIYLGVLIAQYTKDIEAEIACKI
jgi:hypothetical protein